MASLPFPSLSRGHLHRVSRDTAAGFVREGERAEGRARGEKLQDGSHNLVTESGRWPPVTFATLCGRGMAPPLRGGPRGDKPEPDWTRAPQSPDSIQCDYLNVLLQKKLIGVSFVGLAVPNFARRVL